MKLKKFLLGAVSMVLVAALAIGGTVAYLQDEDSAVNVMTLGNVYIEQIEQERDANGNLVDFTQAKPAYPAVGPIEWAATGVDVNGTEYKVFTPELKNVVDKIVTVKNTGKSDAYVRTIVAIEAPEGDPNDLIHVNVSPNGISQTGWTPIEIDGVDYVYSVFTYTEALQPGQISSPSLMQVFLDSEATNEDCAKFGESWEILVLSQAVQTAGFANAQIALDTAFGMASVEAAGWFGGVLAENSADTWDGTADFALFGLPRNASPEEISNVVLDKDTYMIRTAEELAAFAALVDAGNTFEGKTVKLDKDIDLYTEDENGKRISFDPIGYGYNVVFKGTFDGQNHTISNLYQDGWALGLDYSTEGGGLFASVVDATIKDITIDNAEIVMECIDMGALVGYSYGSCTYENITVSNSVVANYNRYTGGVVGEVNGTQTFKNVDVIDTTVSALWGTPDAAVGGIAGGKWGDAKLTFEDCDVSAKLDVFNDACANYQYYNYRLSGMLIGMSEEVTDGTASASYLTCKNCTVTYGDWANYTYCESESYGKGSYAAADEWKFKRVQEGYATGGVDPNHTHDTDESHEELLKFDQLFGGDKGVRGGKTHDGVTVIYNNK